MYLAKILDPAARDHRVRYVIATVLRDRVVNEGAFNNCFEMGDADQVVYIILRRGLKNPRLRAALLGSHVVNLTQWLISRPAFAEAYYASEQSSPRAESDESPVGTRIRPRQRASH